MSIPRKRVHLMGGAFDIVETCRSQYAAQRYYAKFIKLHPTRISKIPGRGWVLLRPINPRTGLPEEYPTTETNH